MTYKKHGVFFDILRKFVLLQETIKDNICAIPGQITVNIGSEANDTQF